MKRIAAHEKFRWRGWEFKQSHATSTEVHWQMRHGPVRIRLIYRDIHDPETPAEFTALIQMHGFAEGEGAHTAGTGVAASADLALDAAERDFKEKIVLACQIFGELRRGKVADPRDR